MHKSFLMKKCSSPSNEFLLHRWRNKFFFSNLKKFTSPANEFLLHKCSNNKKMKKYIFFQIWKKKASFCVFLLFLHLCNGNLLVGLVIFFQIWKNIYFLYFLLFLHLCNRNLLAGPGSRTLLYIKTSYFLHNYVKYFRIKRSCNIYVTIT